MCCVSKSAKEEKGEKGVNYEIIPLKIGEFLSSEKSNFTLMKNQGIKIRTPIIAYLIRNDVINVLVDTGCADESWSQKYHHPIHQPESMKLESALIAAGVKPAMLDFIILTHLHWDHCYNLELFPDKRVYVQKQEIINALFPQKTQIVYYEGYEMGLTPPWVNHLSSFIPVDGNCDVAPGIKLLHLPGHTKGFQGVQISTERGEYLIAGDAIPLYENIEDELYHMIRPSGIYVNLDEYYQTLSFIKHSGMHILPGHDERVFNHYVYPVK